MDDSDIIGMLLERNERALEAISLRYGAYLTAIANNILGNKSDAEECLNDTLLALWNSVPPAIPQNLKAYTAKTVRNIAYNRAMALHAGKRGGGNLPEIFEELENCIPDAHSTEDLYMQKETLAAVNRFLTALPARDQSIFLRRYFFAERTAEIAAAMEMQDAAVRLILSRTRKKLKKYLQREDFLV